MLSTLMTLGALVAPIQLQPFMLQQRASARRASQVSCVVQEQDLQQTALAPEPVWQATADGLKYRVMRAGTGAVPEAGSVVAVHYTVRFASGDVLGTSRGKMPLLFALGKHDVPIFDDAVAGMAVGSSIKLVVPASRIPSSQVRNVPRDQEGESLEFEMELLRVETGIGAFIPSLLAPGTRRMTIMRTLFALSFVPYFIPEAMLPAPVADLFRFGDPAAIRAAHEASSNSVWLGGAATSLDSLFP